MKSRSFLKLVGLAGLAGVAASGVAVARSERRRRSYTPEEVRARLHDRLAEVEGAGAEAEVGPRNVEGYHRFGFADRLNGWRDRLGKRRARRV